MAHDVFISYSSKDKQLRMRYAPLWSRKMCNAG